MPDRDRVDHVAGDHRLGGADPRGGLAPGAGVGEDGGAGSGERARGHGRAGRATIPESTSPVPAVARAGAETALTARRSPSVTIVSSPLRTTIAPAARAASRAQARRCASTSAESRPSSRPSSPACGVRIGRRRAGGEPAEPPGEGVEAVGVDHERRLDLPATTSRASSTSRVAAEPGPEDPGGGLLEGAEHRLRRGRRQAAVPARAADRHHLGQLGLEDQLEVGRDGDRRVAGAGADRGQRGHPHGPGQAARAAGDRHLAGAELGRARRRGAGPGRAPPGSISPPAADGRPGGDADRRDEQLAGVRLPGATRWPILAPWKVTVSRPRPRRPRPRRSRRRPRRRCRRRRPGRRSG